MISVVVADDQALIRQAVTALLAAEPDVQVAAQAVDGRDAVHLTKMHRPDVVVMDIRMPGLDGIRATGQICADPTLAATKVLILTTFEQDDYVVEALRAGASGFLGKGADPTQIVAAVRTIHAGEALLSPGATRSLIRHSVETGPAPPVRALPHDLTERERTVLQLVGEGRANDEIAVALHITPATAKTHVNRVMVKLDAHGRAQLVIAAYESGLVVPGSSPTDP